jgi:hypothetical protein
MGLVPIHAVRGTLVHTKLILLTIRLRKLLLNIYTIISVSKIPKNLPYKS